jgi:arylsulfatase A-like enzyme
MIAAKNNILLISLDDAVAYWHYRRIFGAELQVPNLDRICAEATAFHSAYCQAPVCGPSRASFMSGRTPHQLGVFDNSVDVFDVLPAREMWTVRLKEAGYFCSSGGKVHHTYKPLPRNHHKVIYSDNQKRFTADMHMKPDAAKQKFGGHRGGWATTDPKDDATYYDHQSADSAIDFLNSYQGDAPFYREVGFYSPHGPHLTPLRFKEMYDVKAFRKPPSWADGFASDDFIRQLVMESDKLQDDGLNFWRACVRNYFSAYSHGDHHLGRVWDALKASPHAENTLVVICSDHGFHLGDRRRFSKFTLFEQVAGVPLIIWDPASRQSRSVTDPVALLDIGPTLLDHAGLPPLPDCAGRSLLPYLQGRGDPDRAVPTFWHDSAAIRKGDYRFIRYADGSTQLFDLSKDFWQQYELGPGHPAFGPMYESLRDTCRDHGFAFD